jgi:lipoprotein-anchoring transpeptidase ErfK/SrfK
MEQLWQHRACYAAAVGALRACSVAEAIRRTGQANRAKPTAPSQPRQANRAKPTALSQPHQATPGNGAVAPLRGPGNPLGARAMYLGNTVYRIHGTNAPETIGQAVSSGCFRLANDDVIDLYNRVNVGTKVIVRQD